MAKYQINSILGGISPTYHNNPQNTYLGACGIDPDEEVNNRIGGAITPTNATGFSEFGNIQWFEPNDKNGQTYFYTNIGKFGRINPDESIDEIHNFEHSKGNGLIYYNDYYYIATNNNIHRYGPLDNPNIEEFWWTGLSQAEANGTYTIKVEDGEETNVSGSCVQIIKSLRTRFEDLHIDLKDAKTSGGDYDINIKIRDIEEHNYIIDDGIKLEVDVDVPSGSILASGSINSSALSSDFTTQEIKLNTPFFATRDFAVEVEVAEPVSGRLFAVKTSKESVREGTYFMIKNADYKKDIKYDNTVDEITKSVYPIEIFHSWEVSTSKEHLTSDLIIEFTATFENYWPANGLQIRKSGSAIERKHATVNRVGGLSGTNVSWSKPPNQFEPNLSGNYIINLHPSLEIKNGDTIEIWATSSTGPDPGQERPVTIQNIISEGNTRPFFHYEDEKDISLIIDTDDISFLPLKDQTYSTIGGYEIPNHMMFLHGDDTVYFCDTQNGGVIGRIKTGDLLKVVNITDEGEESDEKFKMGDLIRGEQSNATATIMKIMKQEEDNEQGLVLVNIIGDFIDGEKVVNIVNTDIYGTVDGEIQNGQANLFSESIALRLPKNIYPVAISSIGTDLMIIGISGKGNSYMFLWDTFSDTFYRQTPLPYPIVSATKTHNGIPYIFGGDDKSHSLNIYRGGDSIEQLFYIDSGLPPLQGAIDTTYDRLKWGSSQKYPEEKGCVWALGSKIGRNGIHNILTAGGQVSALKGNYVSSEDNIYRKGGQYQSIWRSELLSFGRPFSLDKITIPLGKDLAENDKLNITIYYDNEEKSNKFEIDNTTYEDRIIRLSPDAQGIHNTFIEIKWETENQIPVNFPIIIEYEIYD